MTFPKYFSIYWFDTFNMPFGIQGSLSLSLLWHWDWQTDCVSRCRTCWRAFKVPGFNQIDWGWGKSMWSLRVKVFPNKPIHNFQPGDGPQTLSFPIDKVGEREEKAPKKILVLYLYRWHDFISMFMPQNSRFRAR